MPKFKIKKAPYNPRTMSAEARSGLRKSLTEFEDISGVTINEKTGNIVSGNHRWEELNSEYGELELQHIFEDRYAIMAGPKFTGFIARVVNWSLKKEKQANITANSPLIAGEFSSKLQDVLKEISFETDESLLDELRLSDLMVDLDALEDDLDLSKDSKRKETEKKKEDFSLEDDEKPKHSEVREIISSLKVIVPSEYKEDVLEAIVSVLSKKEYYDQITIH